MFTLNSVGTGVPDCPKNKKICTNKISVYEIKFTTIKFAIIFNLPRTVEDAGPYFFVSPKSLHPIVCEYFF